MQHSKKTFLTIKNIFLFFFLMCCVFFVASLIIFFSKQPSNDRDWQEEFALMPQAEITGDVVTLKHTRDWRYEKDGSYSKAYVDRTFNVRDLEHVWFLVEPFSGFEGIAHTYFVFDFKNQEPISFSIEARREKGEDFSFRAGLMRNFEMMYLWGSEKDFTVNRIIWQKNQVYMYPITGSPELGQKLFVELAKQTNDLHEHPQFYNTLASNCTSKLADIVNDVQTGALPLHYSRILPGYSPQLLYKLGYIDNSLSFEETKQKYLINPYVEKYYEEKDFSKLLREELAK